MHISFGTGTVETAAPNSLRRSSSFRRLRLRNTDSFSLQVDIIAEVDADVPPPEVRYFGIDTETSQEILQDLRNVTVPVLGRRS
jgi:hypothetical protein